MLLIEHREQPRCTLHSMAPMNAIAAPGQIFAHKYRLLRQLGQGGMGVVWEAEHVTLGLRLAIKVLDPGVSQHPDVYSRFLKEAQAAAALQCEHVVRVFDHDFCDGKPFIVMEKLEGETLAERLDREGPLGPRQTFMIVEQVCNALSRAHEAGIVHRDIKPSNVFLTQVDGQREVVKVLDFGIAKHSSNSDPPTGFGIVMGTPWYMSPEQAQGQRPIDASTDLWATGVLTFECLTGQRPFDDESFRDLVDAICHRPHPSAGLSGRKAESFDAWFQRATSRDRARRFRTAAELVAALRKALDLGGAPLERNTTPTLISPTDTAPRFDSLHGNTEDDSPATLGVDALGEHLGGERQQARRTVTALVVVGLLGCALSIPALRSEPELPVSKALVVLESPSAAAPTARVAKASAGALPIVAGEPQRPEPRVVPANLGFADGRGFSASMGYEAAPLSVSLVTAERSAAAAKTASPRTLARGSSATDGSAVNGSATSNSASTAVRNAAASSAAPKRVEPKARKPKQRLPREVSVGPVKPKVAPPSAQRRTTVDLGI